MAKPTPADPAAGRVRIDKWLWAARFFKTRSLAAEAVAAGKVEVNEERVKPAKLIQLGDSVSVRLGPYLHVVHVRGISERRGPASDAATLYEETAESSAARAKLAEQVATVVQGLRTEHLLKAPGVAETLDWARAVQRLGAEELDLDTASRTLGTVVKYREDTDRVKQALDRMLAG